jgi:chemotaxis protein methyltransferase CheR
MPVPDETQLDMISSVIYRKFGIYTGRDKYERLGLRLEGMVNRGYCSGPDELCARLASGDRQCLEELADFVTTCHTFFFREPEHFRVLVSDIRKHRTERPLIWCAACSTGEEPYSAAITLLEEGITGFRIVASDVNRAVLESFNRGVYHESRLCRTDSAVREKYFTPEGDDGYLRIDPGLRKYISIKNLNLMDRVRFVRQFDYVFCRNVFMYFDGESRKTALAGLSANLKKGGLLFIGRAEVLLSEPDGLEKAGCSVYRRTG